MSGGKKAGDRRWAMVFCGDDFNLGLFMQEFWQAVTTHPMTPWFGWLGLGCVVIYAALEQIHPKEASDPLAKLQKALGAESWPNALFLFLFLTYVLLFILTLVEFLWAFKGEDSAEEDIRNVGLILAAIIGFPFVIWRAVVAHLQVETAQESLLNERISDAINDLYSQRQETIRDPA